MKISDGKRQHKLMIVLSSLRHLKELLIPLLVLFVSHGFQREGSDRDLYWRLAVGAALVVGAFVWGFLRWWWFRYQVEDGALRIEAGVLVKKQMSIPLGRVQTLDTSEGILHRVFGLVQVQVQTAGGTKPEAVFTALSRSEAQWLERALRGEAAVGGAEVGAVGGGGEAALTAGVAYAGDAPAAYGSCGEGPAAALPAGPPPAAYAGSATPPGAARPAASAHAAEPPAAAEAAASGAPPDTAAPGASAPLPLGGSRTAVAPATAPEQEPVYRLPAGRLFLAGLTVNNLGVGISLLFAGLSQADDVFPGFRPFRLLAELSGPRVFLLLAAAVLFFSWLLAVGSSIVRFAGFTVSLHGGDLRITRGLLERNKVTLPVRRIQAVRITRELIWRPFRLAAVHVVCAGYGNRQGESTLLFPLMREEELEPFLRELCPEFAAAPDQIPFRSLPGKALWGYMLPLPLILAAASGAAWWLLPYGEWGFLAAALAAAGGYRSYRKAGYAVEGGRLSLRHGYLTDSVLIVPARRIQYLTVAQNPLQRRSGLAALRLSLAAGPLGSHYRMKGLSYSTAIELLHGAGRNGIPADPKPGVRTDL
ncbi:PH domain-containing protein [Gorillibacterium sp. sgz5001074]|uniref:PH domain-containing protein n=1 Tax=Gorillibacterium sp. sgz5001074 TaxID=3446695 RepID=UPI003F67E3BD